MDSGVASRSDERPAGRNVIICPDCRSENIEGVDTCAVCGADLGDLKRPRANSELEKRLITGKLRDVAVSRALDVKPGDPVFLAVHFMRDQRVECVLVRDESQTITGILTERDILMKAAGANHDLMAMAVRDIMTPDPVMLREDDTLAVALHKMAVGGFRHIPFVDHDGATMIISIQDVFRHVAPYIPHK